MEDSPRSFLALHRFPAGAEQLDSDSLKPQPMFTLPALPAAGWAAGEC